MAKNSSHSNGHGGRHCGGSDDGGSLDVVRLRRRLLAWFDREKRWMPWRETSDPYRILVSEIMLQQTQVATVIPYYERFIERFPTVEALAAGNEQDVLALWAGLGYYSRARNLHRAAWKLAEAGRFPDTAEELVALPGVGPYTAAAVASIVFGRVVACVDGNVMRVVCRLAALEGDPRSGETRRRVEALASEWIAPRRSGDFNQAMMELGAVICQRDAPACLICPLRSLCMAHHRGVEADIPPRRRVETEAREVVIGALHERGRFLISRRPEGGRFGGLWEFPGGGVEAGETRPQALAREMKEEVGLDIEVGEKIAVIKHAYTRFRVTLHAYLVTRVDRSQKAAPLQVEAVAWRRLKELEDVPFPAANQRLIEILMTRFG